MLVRLRITGIMYDSFTHKMSIYWRISNKVMSYHYQWSGAIKRLKRHLMREYAARGVDKKLAQVQNAILNGPSLYLAERWKYCLLIHKCAVVDVLICSICSVQGFCCCRSRSDFRVVPTNAIVHTILYCLKYFILPRSSCISLSSSDF